MVSELPVGESRGRGLQDSLVDNDEATSIDEASRDQRQLGERLQFHTSYRDPSFLLFRPRWSWTQQTMSCWPVWQLAKQ